MVDLRQNMFLGRKFSENLLEIVYMSDICHMYYLNLEVGRMKTDGPGGKRIGRVKYERCPTWNFLPEDEREGWRSVN